MRDKWLERWVRREGVFVMRYGGVAELQGGAECRNGLPLWAGHGCGDSLRRLPRPAHVPTRRPKSPAASLPSHGLPALLSCHGGAPLSALRMK